MLKMPVFLVQMQLVANLKKYHNSSTDAAGDHIKEAQDYRMKMLTILKKFKFLAQMKLVTILKTFTTLAQMQLETILEKLSILVQNEGVNNSKKAQF